LTVVAGLAGCVQTIDRPPVTLPQYATPLVVPAPQPEVRAADAIDAAARTLASELMTKAAPRIGSRRIAILPMRADGSQAEAIATTATDAFRVEAFRSGPYQFVADNDMKRALNEALLEDRLRRADKALDRSVLPRLGKMLSADLIIDVRITDSVTDLRFTAEMIEIATGELVAIAKALLPKSALAGSSIRYPRPGAGRTLHYGTDWLHTRLESWSIEGDRVVKAVFAFTNRGQQTVQLMLTDPERRAYLVDPTGRAYVYTGVDGLDRYRSATIRPETRHEVSLYFVAPLDARGALTMRTSWRARGTAMRDQDFVVPDLSIVR
jgi:hypothetical protein